MSHAFSDCKWCGGKGCLACPGEREKAEQRALEPIFTAKLDDPHDMKLMKEYLGREAMEKAFREGGGGAQEIEHNAAIASFIQHLHRSTTTEPEETDTPER